MGREFLLPKKIILTIKFDYCEYKSVRILNERTYAKINKNGPNTDPYGIPKVMSKILN